MFNFIKFYNKKNKQQKYTFEIYSVSSVYDNIYFSVNLSYRTYV